jgi:hypothetical protein
VDFPCAAELHSGFSICMFQSWKGRRGNNKYVLDGRVPASVASGTGRRSTSSVKSNTWIRGKRQEFAETVRFRGLNWFSAVACQELEAMGTQTKPP